MKRTPMLSLGRLVCLGAVLMAVSRLAGAAELKPETTRAWDEYLRTANSAVRERSQPNHHFLWIDEVDDRRQRVRSGEILVAPVGEHVPMRVASGLVHHWIGATFIPGATVDAVISVVRHYERYPDYYKPYVAGAKPLSQDVSSAKFSMVLLNKALVSKFALDSEYETTYVQLDQKRWYSSTYTTSVREIRNYGQSNERALEPGQGSGYIWRLYSAARFHEADGGVYVEVEAIALSRDIPAALHMFVDPIVRRTSRNSLITSLEQTHAAVQSNTEVAKQPLSSPSSKPVGLAFR